MCACLCEGSARVAAAGSAASRWWTGGPARCCMVCWCSSSALIRRLPPTCRPHQHLLQAGEPRDAVAEWHMVVLLHAVLCCAALPAPSGCLST
ncbi:hypothetical protein E2C01_051453 [Portunus trituberculatus]|uniref:Uncharacterized protein n=1 Tax=Portunus trituberculatus TaxID=210409 RepID=A0A5B7GJ54_PORTR|nr:hypothetical protein [Portunus trituberculatus]